MDEVSPTEQRPGCAEADYLPYRQEGAVPSATETAAAALIARMTSGGGMIARVSSLDGSAELTFDPDTTIERMIRALQIVPAGCTLTGAEYAADGSGRIVLAFRGPGR